MKTNQIMKPSKALINRLRQDLMSKTSEAEKAAIHNCELLGYKAVRQQPIATGRKLYFADIYLPELKVIMEIDGGYHYTNKQKRKDSNRSAGIWRMGYHVVRLSNHDARNINKVKAKIELIKKNLHDRKFK
jgi:very-short-patch-repair endonuclease|nr:MAG TPA: Very-short-patch-repair endonuclease [Caudoviricetes sp.]